MLQIVKKDHLSDDDILKWNQLWSNEETASIWNSYNWYSACKQTVFPGIEVWYVYQADELVAIIPLEQKKFRFVTCLTTFGQPYTDKSTILIKKDYLKQVPYIIENLGVKIPVVLNEIEHSQCSEYLSDVLHEVSNECPYIDLKQDIIEQVKRSQWNRINNKAKICTYKFEVHQGEAAQNYINKIWEIEEISNKEELGRIVFVNDKIKDLYRKMSLSPETMITLLLDNDKVIACTLGFFIKGNSYLMHNWGYDIDYKKETPGKMIFLFNLRFLLSHNCIKFDFSRGVSLTKKYFSIYSENNYTLFLNLKGINKIWFKLMIILRRYHHNTNENESFLHKQLFKIWSHITKKRSFG